MSTAPASTERTKRSRLVDGAILLLMVSPNLVWILLDRGRWVSDTSFYGLHATRLHHTLLHDTANWWREMLAVGPKPPILPWLGQFFVTLGRWIGNIDIGLLLLIFAAQYGALWFLLEALTTLLRKRRLALVGCFSVASAPMFIVLSTQFYVQTVQLLVVCWFLYVMARSRSSDLLTTVLHLAAASAFAMLVIVSAPAYCAVPGLVALAHAWVNRRAPIRLGPSLVGLSLVALAVTMLAAVWYHQNLDRALAYGHFAVTWVYGANVRDVFLLKFLEWLRYALYGFAFSAFIPLLLPWALAIASRREGRLGGGEGSEMLLLGVQVAVIFLAAASTAQQTFRYILTAVPYLAVLGSWSLSRIDYGWLRRAAVLLLALQLVVTNLGLYFWDDGLFLRNRRRYLAVLDDIQSVTGADRATVWLGTGELGVYAGDAAYHASKRENYYQDNPPEYHSIETSLAETGVDVETLWKRIEWSIPADVVLMRIPPVPRPENAYDMWQRVIEGTGEISARVRKSPKFEKMVTPEGWEVEIYRSVEGR
jgi:hypothetical protein